jgi:hypothetical protein
LGAVERITQLNDHWGVYGDFVYMRRAHSSDKPLADDLRKVRSDCICDFTVLDTKQLINKMGFEPGYRVGAIFRANAKSSFEANFLYLHPWEAKKEVEARHEGDTLIYPFTFGKRDRTLILEHDPAILRGEAFTRDFFRANRAIGKYKAQFWDAELNYWWNVSPRWINYFGLSTIFGLRYFHYNEDLKDTFYKRPSPENPPGSHSDYRIKTYNHAYGAQVGFNLQLNPLPYFSWEFGAKFGFMMDDGKQKTHLRDQNNHVSLWDSSSQRWQDGVFGDAMALLEFYFKEHINVHAGYQFLYLSGIATAEDQLVRRVSGNSGKTIHTHGVAMIHGLFAGLTVSF